MFEAGVRETRQIAPKDLKIESSESFVSFGVFSG